MSLMILHFQRHPSLFAGPQQVVLPSVLFSILSFGESKHEAFRNRRSLRCKSSGLAYHLVECICKFGLYRGNAMPSRLPRGIESISSALRTERMHFLRFKKMTGYDKFSLAGHCWGNGTYQILCCDSAAVPWMLHSLSNSDLQRTDRKLQPGSVASQLCCCKLIIRGISIKLMPCDCEDKYTECFLCPRTQTLDVFSRDAIRGHIISSTESQKFKKHGKKHKECFQCYNKNVYIM